VQTAGSRASVRRLGRLLRKTLSPSLRARRNGDAGVLLIRPDPSGRNYGSREKPRAGSRWHVSSGSPFSARSTAHPSVGKALKRARNRLFETVRDGARGKAPGNRSHGGRRTFVRDEKPKRVSASRRPSGRHGVRIFAVSKTLKPRGIVISWSSEQENAMSETAGRDLAPKGVRLCEGERL
jgi:hypothetical protein